MRNKMAKSPVFILFLIIVSAGLFECSLNPYKTLSVSKSASQPEIKRAYKKLAREWHPDKSDDPNASDKFIKIQQSYEILSDEAKRREYDQFGIVDPQESQRRQRDPFADQFFQQNNNFGGGFNFHNSGNNDPRRVTLSRLQDGILPQSTDKPYLIFVTGSFCFNCMNIERMWSDITPEIESWGVGVGSVNIDSDRRLASVLGIRHRPAIAGIINGQVTDYGQGSVTLKAMRDFVDRLLPSSLIQEVHNNNYEDFFANFYNENKPRVLLYSRNRDIPIIFKVGAFAFREHQTFGFTSAKYSNTDGVLKHVGVQHRTGKVLVFKENIKESVDMVEEKHMTLEALTHLLNYNKYLYLPRLSSQTLFEEMCPETPNLVGRKLCVIQITKATPEHEPFRASFRDMVMSTPSWPHEAKMTYMLFENQEQVAAAMEGLMVEVLHAVPVAIVWRQRGNQIRHAWLPDGWEGQDITMERRGIKEFLYRLNDGTSKFAHKGILPQFNDENAPAWPIRKFRELTQKMTDLYNAAYNFIFGSSWESSSLLMLMMVIYFGCFVLAFLGLFGGSKEPKEASQENNEGGERSQPRAKRSVSMKELGRHEYANLIERKRNSWHLILLVKDSSRSSLCQQLSKELGSYPLRLPLNFVSIDKQTFWYRTLVPGKEVGTILAIRPSKKQYSVFHPTTAPKTSSDRDPHLRHRHGDSGEMDTDFIGFNDSDDEGARRNGVGGGGGVNIFHGFCLWLDRLQDGELRKMDVAEWPNMD
ncbi:dnaJ homolog subfamily C member 16-like isoform X1 [Strongylocentrotus purpuratus]|uniref:J domain-containing protein n=1 Tax=Strongylocentrotus purpuratus TaxID=7668 RepID=A0A7M7SVX0_STRPU|nr:dnaJ homolog subfamily C member 16-like isoform X1 [Strongylocentrotus purpuratus]